MTQKPEVPVSVLMAFNSVSRRVAPLKLTWNNRNFIIEKIGYHHTHQQGAVLVHIFSVVSGSTFFRLSLNTKNLFWKLEEVSDGEGS